MPIFFCSSHEFLLLDSFILIYWSLELIDVDGKAMTSKNLGIVLFILVLFFLDHSSNTSIFQLSI
jgi:hypothetical protein